MSPVSVAQRTLGQTFVEVAALAGVWRNQGTATAGTALTLTDATNERTLVAQKTNIVGTFLYIYAATAAGTIRELTDYATLGVFTWVGNATTPDATSKWVRVSINPQIILDAIDDVTRLYGRWLAQPAYDESLVAGSLLDCYGDFESWASGTTVAPDGWTLSTTGTPTIARLALADVSASSGVIGHGLYLAAVTPPQGSVATLTRTLPFQTVRPHASETLRLEGLLAESAAADVTLRIAVTPSTGSVVNTDWAGSYTSYHWQELEAISTQTAAVSSTVYQVAVQARFAAAASVGYVDDLILYGPGVEVQDLPGNLLAMNPVIFLESEYGSDRYSLVAVNGKDFHVVPGNASTHARIVWHNLQSRPRHVRIEGLLLPTVQSTVTSNVDVLNAEALAILAAKRTLERTPNKDQDQWATLQRLDVKARDVMRGMMGNTRMSGNYSVRLLA